jgi:integrase
MARANRDSRLETRTARLKLDRGERFWLPIGVGVALGYRRTAHGFGMWSARLLDRITGRYTLTAIGEADDYQDADGESVLSFSQAQEKARRVAAEANSVGRASPITVAEAAERYLRWYQEYRKAYNETEHTVNAHILPALGETLVCELRASDIRAWLHNLASQPARKRTRLGKRQQFHGKATTEDAKRARRASANRILTVLKAILNRAFHDELVGDDTAWRRVKLFENADEPVTRFLTEAESKRLINASRADLRRLVKAALFTGARYSELARITARDVNTDTGTVYIQPSKSGRGRYVPLHAAGLDFFRGMVAGTQGDELVFTKADGAPWGKSHHTRPLREACGAAKITPAVGFHDLRHTYASLLAQAGADLLTISKLLGHADTRITSRHYAHLCDRTLAHAVNTLLPGFGHQPDTKVVSIV